MAEPPSLPVSVVQRTCTACHARKPRSEFPPEGWQCWACHATDPQDSGVAAAAPPPSQPPSTLEASGGGRRPAKQLEDDVRSLSSIDSATSSSTSGPERGPRTEDEDDGLPTTIPATLAPESAEADYEEELMDLLVVLGKHVDGLVGVVSDLGRPLRADPHATALLTTALLLAWLHHALPLLLGAALGLLPLLLAGRPSTTSPAGHFLIATRSLEHAARPLEWATALPLRTLASGPLLGVVAAWLLSPTSLTRPVLRVAGAACASPPLPPWAGLTALLVVAVVGLSRRRGEAGLCAVGYFILFFAILSANQPSLPQLLLLVLAVMCHGQGLREREPGRRFALLGSAAALYGGYLAAVGLGPELTALLVGVLRFVRSLRGRSLQRLAHLIVRAISELPGFVLFACSALSVRQGQRATPLHKRLGWYSTAVGCFAGALGAWDVVDAPEWLLELSEAVGDAVLFVTQLPLLLLTALRHLRSLTALVLRDFFHFALVLPLRLLQLAFAVPRRLLALFSGGLSGLVGRLLYLPIRVLALLTQRLRFLLAENFWVLEYVLKRAATAIGSVGDALSGERVAETIT